MQVKASIFFLTTFFSVFQTVWCVDWPQPGVIPESNFALNEEGEPHLSVSFSVSGQVYASDSGEIVFMRTEGERVSGMPSPFGTWISIDSGNDLDIVYARLGGIENGLSAHIEKNQVIGNAGKSGAAEKDGICFLFYDKKERRWINPEIIINPFNDTKPPVISSVKLKDQQGRDYHLSQTHIIPQGRYAIIAEIYDTIDGGARNLAPHKTRAFVNGIEAGALNFESFSAQDGMLMVFRNTILPAKQIYAENGFYEIGDSWFSRGITMLELLAEDRAGNSRSVSYRLSIE